MGKERTQGRARPTPYTITKEVQVLKYHPAAKDSDIEVVLEVTQQKGKGNGMEEMRNGSEKESGRGEKEKEKRSEERSEEEDPWKGQENPWRHIHFLEAGVSWGSN